MDINEFANKNNLHDKDIVALVQSEFPKYDKHLHSKVKRPDEYGVRLVEGAEALIIGHAPVTSCKAHSAQARPYRYYIRYRVSKRKRERLQLCLIANGYDTMQDFLNDLTDYFLDHQEILDKERRNL
jgi:hypothetical protein